MSELTDNEKGIIGMVRLNRVSPIMGIKKEFHLGRFSMVFHWRSKENLWGRFGGGWNWELGVLVGSTTVILNLLVFSLRFSW